MAEEKDFHLKLQTDGNSTGLFLEVYLPTPHCPE